MCKWSSFQEKKRLTAKFPACPYDDEKECQLLLAIHKQWVQHGDNPPQSSQTSRDYPLPHKAYSSGSSSNESHTQSGSDGAEASCTEKDSGWTPGARLGSGKAGSKSGSKASKRDSGGSGCAVGCTSSCLDQEQSCESGSAEKKTEHKKSLVDELFECIKNPRREGNNVITYTPAAERSAEDGGTCVDEQATGANIESKKSELSSGTSAEEEKDHEGNMIAPSQGHNLENKNVNNNANHNTNPEQSIVSGKSSPQVTIDELFKSSR